MSQFLFRGSRLIARKMGYELKAKSTIPDNIQAMQALDLFRNTYHKADEPTCNFLKFCAAHAVDTNSQLFQDLFVLYQTGEKSGGFFVEFGATNGLTYSNTYLLESIYGWTGVLAEPARAWHSDLQTNRQCAIDLRCVTDKSGEIVFFNETDWLELSTIETYSGSDLHAKTRRGAKRYEVPTVSLNDLLKHYSAPADIDYMSVDTEGSELMILKALDFEAYRPRIITVEHNFTEARAKLYELLTSKGYSRILSDVSQFDDWYVLSQK